MIKKLKTHLAALALSVTAAAPCLAAEGDLYNVIIDSVGVVTQAFGQHQAGNVEIAVRGGFVLPSGLYCSSLYLTTPKSLDPNRQMFKQLLEAVTTWGGQLQRLRISDQANGFPGRCGIVAVELMRTIN